jgi:hypothetical protein
MLLGPFYFYNLAKLKRLLETLIKTCLPEKQVDVREDAAVEVEHDELVEKVSRRPEAEQLDC